MSMADISQQLQQQQLTATQRLALLACFKTTLTLEEAAAYAGLSLSHFYKLTSTGKVPHYKPSGKVIYVDRAELDIWLMCRPMILSQAYRRKLSHLWISGVKSDKDNHDRFFSSPFVLFRIDSPFNSIRCA